MVILDTNFIIYCVKQKIFFDEQIKELVDGAEIVVPNAVKKELEKISTEEKKYEYKERMMAKICLSIIKDYKEINVKGKYADSGIINYCKKSNEKIYVATMDKNLSYTLKGKVGIIIIKGLKKLSLG